MSLMDLIEMHAELAFDEGCSFVLKNDKKVQYYAHKRAELFEKIQKIVQGLEVSDA